MSEERREKCDGPDNLCDTLSLAVELSSDVGQMRRQKRGPHRPEGEPPVDPVRSTHRGHEIEEKAPDVWVYADTGDRVSDDPGRDCGACGRAQTDEGHDPCLGTLPGVMNACCGHGDAAEAYVQFAPDDIIRGPDALTWIREATPAGQDE